MTSELNQLLSLPVETLVVLGAGYVSYRLAYTGRDAGHRAVDTIFLTVVFAAIAKLVFEMSGSTVPTAWAALVGSLTAVLAAAFWRRFGSGWVRWLMRQSRVSLSDAMTTAWDTVRTNEKASPSQLLVRRRDGTLLMCDVLADFAEERFGPCVYGDDGSIALFVTHQMGVGDDDWEPMPTLNSEGWGRLLTYIPASEITSIYVRT